MEVLMNTIRRAVFIMVALILIAAPAVAQEITIALGSEPTTLDPQIREDGGERAVNDNVYETLMARTSDGKLVPGLAAAEPKLVDPKTWEVKLRPGVKFHNGEPFNADAVVHSVKRIMDPGFKSEQISFFSSIKDAKKVDDLTVQIITDGPDPILPGRLYWMKMVPPKHSRDPKFANLRWAPALTNS
jgi:peptide/nickel transport system substrate-binding protein